MANAREADQPAIDSEWPEPIRAGLGVDILARLVWEVDYERGVLWLPSRPPTTVERHPS